MNRLNDSNALFDSSDGDQSSNFTRRNFVRLLFKHKLLILICFAMVSTVSMAAFLLLPSDYEISAKILIKTEQEGKPSFFTGVAAYSERTQTDPVNRQMETEMELLEALPLIEKVVKDLNIQFDQVYHPALVHVINAADRVLESVSSVVGIKANPEKRGVKSTAIAFVKSLKVEPIRSKSSDTNSNIIMVTLKTPDREIGRKALAHLLEVFGRFHADLNDQAAKQAYEILDAKMKSADVQVQAAQEKLKQFLANKQFVRSKAMARRDSININAIKNVTSSANPEGVDDGRLKSAAANIISSPRDDTTIAVLRAKLIEMELQLVELEQQYSANNERVLKLKSSIDKLKSRISHESNAYAENESTLITLERDLQAVESTYSELKRKLAQIDLFIELNRKQMGNRIVVEPPSVPLSSNWKKSLLLSVLTSFAGLMIGLAIAGFREYMDHTLADKQSAKKYLDLDVIGIIPLETFATKKTATKKVVINVA